MNVFTKIIRPDLLGEAPLEGKMIFAVKANIGCGHQASAGSYSLRNWVPRGVSCVVRPLVASGHKIAGITNMHELAFGITSVNPAFGAVGNPYKAGFIAGGSSGGSAAAVAMGAVSYALGTDTGGSMLIPAALCGVVGYRPSTGLLYGSTDAIVCPLSSTTDTIGIFARDVSTIQKVHKIIVPYPPLALDTALTLKGMRIGVPEYLYSVLDDEVCECTKLAHQALEKAEVELVHENFSAELTDDLISSCNDLVVYEAYNNLPRYLEEQGAPVRFDKLSDGEPKRIIASGAYITKEEYKLCVQKVTKIRKIFKDYFQSKNLDAFVCPTTILPAVAVPDPKEVSVSGNKMSTFAAFTRNTFPQACAGVPCVSLPCGLSSAGLPIGLMVVGRHGKDNDVLGLAAAMQRVFLDTELIKLPPKLKYSGFKDKGLLCPDPVMCQCKL